MKPTTHFLELVPGFPDPDPDPQLERVLGAARAVAEPELVNRERVTAALRLALSQAAEPSALGHGKGVEVAEKTASGVKARAPSAALRGLRTPLLGLLLGGALIGALGFWLGHGMGRAAGLSEALAAQATEVAAAPLMPAPRLPQSVPSPPQTAASSPVGLEPDHALAARAKAESETARGSRASLTKSAGQSASRRAAHVPKQEPSAMTFREVLEQLRRARQQLDSGQATLSLLLLSELDRSAGELLREERETTRVLALCATGQNEAARRAAALLSNQSPRSIYAMRLSSSCASGAAGLE